MSEKTTKTLDELRGRKMPKAIDPNPPKTLGHSAHRDRTTRSLMGQAAFLPQEGYVRLSTVLSIFPVSKSTWWAGVRSGTYPPGVKISARCTAWDVSSIRELLAQVEAQS